jgi:uncharacterized protein (TIGR02001 family)
MVNALCLANLTFFFIHKRKIKMKNTFKLKTLALSVAMASSSMAILAPTAAQAEVTGNMGVVSQYIFRGIPQSAGAAAQGGIDYANESGFYAGIWSSTVAGPLADGKGDGYGYELEYDIYGGYETEVSGVTLGAGITLYRYTHDEWDDDYNELNLWAGFGDFSFSANIGEHKNEGDAISYTVVTASYAFGNAHVLYGLGQDFAGKGTDHSWFELGYAAEVTETLEAGITLIYTDKDVSGTTVDGAPKGNLSMVVGLTKSFDLM